VRLFERGVDHPSASRAEVKERPKLYLYSLFKHYATNRQDAGSIPDGVIGIFQ
jgi:hypothetical protein